MASGSGIAPWANNIVQATLSRLATTHHERGAVEVAEAVQATLAAHHRRINSGGVVLYAGTNVLSPAVRSAHDSALATRPSLGWPGEKGQTGVQEIEELEVVATTQVAGSMRARYAEVRFPTATMANLALYSAFTRPGDTIAVLSPEAGGHASHHAYATAGIRGLNAEYLPYLPEALDIDVSVIGKFLRKTRPKVVLVGGSVTLFPHDLAPLREAADLVGALLAYDASHTAGLIASGHVQNPLTEGAHVVTFSTYKTYAGPAGGAAVTNEPALAECISHAAYPVLTSNYDAARLGPLAIAAAEAVDQQPAWARATIASAQLLAAKLASRGRLVVARRSGHTSTHQVVLDVSGCGGGQCVTARLERHGLYASACRLPWQRPNTRPGGLRLGTQEIVRLGATQDHIAALAVLLDAAIDDDNSDNRSLAVRSAEIRRSFGADIWGHPVAG